MDAFAGYENLAGLFIGNEVITAPNGTAAAPYVKAATRDMKAYRDSKGYRKIPIGYSAADIATIRPMLQNYLACGTDTSDTIEFYGLNAYEWCGESSYEQSGYATLNGFVTDYPIPIFFTETGCNVGGARTFDDQTAIFGDQMSPYWSGAMIYEWIEEANNYGLISYGAHVDPSTPGAPPDGWPRSGTPQPVQPDFDNLKAKWAAVAPAGVNAAAYTATNPPIACPASTAGSWEVNPTAGLPQLNGGIPTGTTATAAPTSSVKTGGAQTVAKISTSAVTLAVISQTGVTVAVTMTARSIKSAVLPGVLLVGACWVAFGNIIAL
jgi:1,3-beta-glucanosyltransferase GAS1